MTTATVRTPRTKSAKAAAVPPKRTPFETLADVIAAAGDVPPEWIVYDPMPGTATEEDVVRLDGLDMTCELVNGILIKEPMGNRDDRIAFNFGTYINVFVLKHNLGVMGGAQALLRLRPGLVRLPDFCFTPWGAIVDEDQENAFQDAPPALVVEVLSPSNTAKAMARKLEDYATAGVKLAWYVNPRRQEVDVYVNARLKSKKTLTTADTLSGGKVLPGFTLPVKTIFEDRRPPKPKKKTQSRLSGTCG